MPVLEVNQKKVRLTNLDRVLWPEQGYTKHDLIRYYIEAAPFLLPHLQNRPLVVQRFPGGIDGEAFYQKNAPEGAPIGCKRLPLSTGKAKKPVILLPPTWRRLSGWATRPAWSFIPGSPVSAPRKTGLCRLRSRSDGKNLRPGPRGCLTVREVLLHLNLESFPSYRGRPVCKSMCLSSRSMPTGRCAPSWNSMRAGAPTAARHNLLERRLSSAAETLP